MQRFEQIRYQLIGPVNRQIILDEVVGADAEVVDFPDDLVRDGRSSRHLDHDSERDVLIERNPLLSELPLHLPEHGLHLLDLLQLGDHGNEDADILRSTGPQDGSKLNPEDLAVSQRKADRAQPQGRVGLFLDTQLRQVLLTPDIDGADIHGQGRRLLRELGIDAEMILLLRELGTLKIDELRTETSDPLGTH